MTDREKINLRRKWKRWLDVIGHDLGNLLISKDIHSEIRRLAALNKQIYSPQLFYNWLVNNYIDSVSVRVRRLSDHDRRAISLYRLIGDISKNRDAIIRQYYVSQYPKHMREDGSADYDFNDFAAQKANLISESRLNRDMKHLKIKTDRIKTFVDKWVAHFDLDRKRFKVPTHKDLNNALEDVDRLYCKYDMLLTGVGRTTRKPVLQYDWKEPLRHTWLTADSKSILAAHCSMDPR